LVKSSIGNALKLAILEMNSWLEDYIVL
jgi:hypothetical protein